MSANSDTSAAPHGQTSPATASSPTTMPANANLQIRDLDSMIVMALVRIYASLPDQQAARTALLHGTQAEQNRALLGPLCMVLQQFERFEQASAAAAAADSPDGPITYIASSPPLASSTNNPYAAIFPPSSVPLLLYDGAPAAVRRLGFATARLTLCHIVARLAASAYPGGPREYRQSAEYRLAAATARDSIDIVMGTLPYLCGWDPSVADLGRLNLGRGCESEDGLVPSLLVFTLWPVFSCAASEFALPQQRAYLAGFLRFLANYAGISLAAALVDFCAAIDNGSVSDDLLQRIRSTLTSSI